MFITVCIVQTLYNPQILRLGTTLPVWSLTPGPFVCGLFSPFILWSLDSPLDGWAPNAGKRDRSFQGFPALQLKSRYLLPQQTMRRQYGLGQLWYTLTWERFQSVALLYLHVQFRSTWFSCTVPSYSNCHNGHAGEFGSTWQCWASCNWLAVASDGLLLREAAGLLLSQWL